MKSAEKLPNEALTMSHKCKVLVLHHILTSGSTGIVTSHGADGTMVSYLILVTKALCLLLVTLAINHLTSGSTSVTMFNCFV